MSAQLATSASVRPSSSHATCCRAAGVSRVAAINPTRRWPCPPAKRAKPFFSGPVARTGSFAEALTTYGIIGVKTWIYKGEVFDFSQVGQEKVEERNERPSRPARDRDAR